MTNANLFDPFDLHGLKLPNRILMSAMTRTRATEDDVPTDLMSEYYVQRASAGLIVTECTQVSDQGHGIIRAPGIHRADQIVAWRKVTDAVHAVGGHIYNQTWHCGRVAHPDMRGGTQPVAPSAIPATGDVFLPSGRVDFPPKRTGFNKLLFPDVRKDSCTSPDCFRAKIDAYASECGPGALLGVVVVYHAVRGGRDRA